MIRYRPLASQRRPTYSLPEPRQAAPVAGQFASFLLHRHPLRREEPMPGGDVELDEERDVIAERGEEDR